MIGLLGGYAHAVREHVSQVYGFEKWKKDSVSRDPRQKYHSILIP